MSLRPSAVLWGGAAAGSFLEYILYIHHTPRYFSYEYEKFSGIKHPPAICQTRAIWYVRKTEKHLQTLDMFQNKHRDDLARSGSVWERSGGGGGLAVVVARTAALVAV